MFGAVGPHKQLVRFALPRRVYTQSHVDYVAAVAQDVARVREQLPSVRIVEEPRSLRHFTAALTPSHPFPEA
jgi:tryptophanase